MSQKMAFKQKMTETSQKLTVSKPPFLRGVGGDLLKIQLFTRMNQPCPWGGGGDGEKIVSNIYKFIYLTFVDFY